MSLKLYRKKRDFTMTPEPSRSKKATMGKLRYVIQKHAASHLHYDFRLEMHGVLKSWAVPKGPSLNPNVKRLAIHVEDHPLDYGDFEGTIPKGQYGGGTVMLWDQGTWSCEENIDTAYKKGHITFELQGKKLHGIWTLIRLHQSPNQWLLIKVQDRYAKTGLKDTILDTKNRSVTTHRTMDQITQADETKSEKKNQNKRIGKKAVFPTTIKPELATLVDLPPEGNDWLHEIKFDGYRLLVFIQNKKIQLITRGNHNWTDKFSQLLPSLKKIAVNSAIIDGEVTVLDAAQHSNFQLLQNAIKEQTSDFIYYAFDLIYYNGCDLSAVPLIERKELLKKILPKKIKSLQYSDHIIGVGAAIYEESCALGLEGIVSKKISSHYLQRRTQHWLKCKCHKRQEFVIVGYTAPKANRQYFGSLILGVWNKSHQLIYAGHVGTGFNASSLKSIYQLLVKQRTKLMPFAKRPPNSKHITWVLPVLVAEVEFTEWTQEGVLRHPSFKGLRMDKPANNIKKERPMTIETSEVGLTHPDKILYPQKKITKRMLYGYYEMISSWILPHIKNRLLTLVRCPNGQTKTCFYQKHLQAKNDFGELKSIMVKEKHKKESYFYLDNEEGLLLLPQLNVLEIHVWGSQIEQIEQPDMITFDLDPAPDVRWKEVVAAAFHLRKELQKLKLTAFVKSTGGKGLHVVVPIEAHYTWDIVKQFTHDFANFLVQKYPDKYVATITKSKRTGKILIDYLRNQRGATAVAAYSTRARDNATVAAPLAWEELTSYAKDTLFTIKTMHTRLENLKKDPWEKFFKMTQVLRLY